MIKLVSILGLNIFVSLLGSCAEDPVPSPTGVIGDGGFNLIEYGHITDVDPSSFIPGDPLHFSFVYNCRYTGKGGIQIYGRGGGSPIGELVAPVSEELGVVYFELPINTGENTIKFTILPTTGLDALGFGITISCDSLLVDGELVYWLSPEGHSFFGDDIPPNTVFLSNGVGDLVTIPRAED